MLKKPSTINPPPPPLHVLTLYIFGKVLSGKSFVYANWVAYSDHAATALAKFENQVADNPDWASQLGHPKTEAAIAYDVTYLEGTSALLVSGPSGHNGLQGVIRETFVCGPHSAGGSSLWSRVSGWFSRSKAKIASN